ncbi:MAG TPA: hypothetical protein VFA26_14535 [Gemmataceae bacterium]|nr:hypothetical protein [Gemmataceae bacterium]
MAREDYVPVTGDDWYQRRRDDAEGRFFRKVADQGPRKGAGGSTRQGIYCFTASGKLLAYKNAGQAPEVMRDVLKQALRQWQKLPASERQPGAVQVGEPGKADQRYARTPPPGGLVLNVFTRILDRDEKEGFRKGACQAAWGDMAARDHLWLTEAEWKALIPADPKKGGERPVPAAVVERIARFHLVDNTRGEPPLWRRDQVRSKKMTLTVEAVTPKEVRLRLDGSALLATKADPKEADRGYDVRLLGYVTYDPAARKVTRFDVVAVGDHWGEGTFTRGARPGRAPLGVAFELSAGKSAADTVPPQGAREWAEYMGRNR